MPISTAQVQAQSTAIKETTWTRNQQNKWCQRTFCWWASHPSRRVWQTTCRCEQSCDSWGSAPASCGWLWTAACDTRRKGRSPIAHHPQLEKERTETEKGEWSGKLWVFVSVFTNQQELSRAHNVSLDSRKTPFTITARMVLFLLRLVAAKPQSSLTLYQMVQIRDIDQ